MSLLDCASANAPSESQSRADMFACLVSSSFLARGLNRTGGGRDRLPARLPTTGNKKTELKKRQQRRKKTKLNEDGRSKGSAVRLLRRRPQDLLWEILVSHRREHPSSQSRQLPAPVANDHQTRPQWNVGARAVLVSRCRLL